jgi:hypothetical protein
VRERSPNRDLWVVVSAAVALVLFRSFVFLWYEQNFSSDQAIVGLMAKHLSEFRAFPLFFYGQNYMLGVESWIAVPFFWLGGPTVTMLRLPLLLINAAVVILLIKLLTAGGVRPTLAFTAALPIVACGPVAAVGLLSTLGASIEPLLYVIVLWMWRARPVPFGVLLCIGSLHREFTMFALPAIVVLEWLELRKIRWPAILKPTLAFGVTWIVIDQLKRHVNISGPGADASAGAGGSLALEAVQVARLVSFHPAVYLARLHLLLTQGLPDLFGARPLPLFTGGVWGDGSVGSWFAGGALAAATILCAGRLLWFILKGRPRSATFPVFLFLVSVQAIVAYGLHGGTDIEFRTELNYVLLVLFLPVALFGAYFQLEAESRYRQTAVFLIAAWALPTLGDSARLAREYRVSPPANAHRVLADYLTQHRIKYAWAGYWDSYHVTFLSKERVIVASEDTVRVPGYQIRVELNRLNAARLVRLPCDDGTHVAEWCVIDPFQR